MVLLEANAQHVAGIGPQPREELGIHARHTLWRLAQPLAPWVFPHSLKEQRDSPRYLLLVHALLTHLSLPPSCVTHLLV